jgi:hypothetical protein
MKILGAHKRKEGREGEESTVPLKLCARGTREREGEDRGREKI